MIELFVEDGRQWNRLDTLGTENISLTFQVDEVRNIKNKNASYSKNFNIPATKKNNNFFEHYYDLDRYNLNFNAYKSVRCFLKVDGITILEGYLKLLGTLEKQTEITYSIVIYNDVANLIDTLGDTTLASIDVSSLEHIFSYPEVVKSWEGINVAGSVVDYSYAYISEGSMYEDGGETFNVPHRNWIMNVRLKYIIDKIFSFAGFSYDSTFLSSEEFKRLYFDTTAIKDYGQQVDAVSIVASDLVEPWDSWKQIGNNTPDAPAISFNGIVFANNFANAFPFEWSTETGDTTNQFNLVSNTYTATSNSAVNFEATLRILNGTNLTKTIKMYANNIEIGSVNVQGQSPTNPNIANYTISGQIDMLLGQTATITFAASGQPTFALGIYDFGLIVNDVNQLKISATEQSIQDLITTQLGNIKLADIIRDTFKMFNLIATDKGNQELKIEPYVNYISDNEVDWTNKVDINEFKIENIDIPKKVTFKHATDNNDFFLEEYFVANGLEYGSHSLEFDVDNAEEDVIELSVFAAPFIKTFDVTDITIQHIAKESNDGLEPFKNKPRIVYRYNDTVNDTFPTTAFYFNPIEEFYDWQTGVDVGIYPQLTHYNKLIQEAGNTDNSYLFGLINPDAIDGLQAQPINTLFFRYWRSYIEEKYNVDTYILKCKITLSPTDILNLDFSKKYRLDKQVYRLNKVDYNTDKNKLSSVELIRV